MALRTWGRTLLTAAGVAAVVGAGQLGFGYGLGIVRLARDFTTEGGHHWHGQLAWVAWCAMVATLVGAIAGRSMATRHQLDQSAPGRVVTAIVAGVGATVVAPLTMQPARDATLAVPIDPVFTVGLTAILAAVAGMVFASAALWSRTIAGNLAAIIAAVWLLALVSAAPSLGPNDRPATVRLGVLDLPWLTPDTTRTVALLGIPLFALLMGVICGGIGRIARRRSRTRLGRHGLPDNDSADDLAPTGMLTQAIDRLMAHPGSAACGVAGAGMLAVAYLLAGPGGAPEQATPYWSTLIGLGAGVLGSTLVTVAPTGADLATRRRAKAARVAEAAVAEAKTVAEAAASAGAHPAIATNAGTQPTASQPTVSQATASRPAGRRAAAKVTNAPETTPTSQVAEAEKASSGTPASVGDRGETPTSTRTTNKGRTRAGGSSRAKIGGRASNDSSASTPVDLPSPPSPALTEPTPDPLTAPLEQLQPSKRAARQRARTAAAKNPATSDNGAAKSPTGDSDSSAANSASANNPVTSSPTVSNTDRPSPTVSNTDRPSPRPRPPGSRPSPRPRRAPVTPQPETLPQPTTPPEPATRPTPKDGPEAPPEAESAVKDEPRKSRFRLLRRGSRNVPTPREPAEPERITPHEEEYVEWVTGLGGDSGSRRDTRAAD